MGAFSYLASPIWALTLLVGLILTVQAKYATPSYFGTEASLFPKWPVFDAQLALSLFLATVLIVHLPKLLGAAWALRNPDDRRRHRGVLRLVSGVLLESVLSTLIAPILMITQTSAVFSILLGRDSGWRAQQRVAAGATMLQFVRQHRWHLAWGAAGAGACWSISLAALAWMSPIILGLLLAGPIALITGRSPGMSTAALLATDIELQQPPLIVDHASRRKEWLRA
jgi:membrane glycosyltransferase